MFVNNDGKVAVTREFRSDMGLETATKKSVEKWEFIVAEFKAGRSVEDCGSGDTCALCHWDINNSLDYFGCPKCPVQGKTGEDNCRNTPYKEFRNTPNQKNAQAMLDFLKSL